MTDRTPVTKSYTITVQVSDHGEDDNSSDGLLGILDFINQLKLSKLAIHRVLKAVCVFYGVDR